MASEVADILRELQARDLLEDAEKIAKRRHVTLEEMFGRARARSYHAARIEFWSYLVHDLGWGLKSVGRLCRRDHGSISLGVRRFRAKDAAKEATRPG